MNSTATAFTTAAGVAPSDLGWLVSGLCAIGALLAAGWVLLAGFAQWRESGNFGGFIGRAARLAVFLSLVGYLVR